MNYCDGKYGSFLVFRFIAVLLLMHAFGASRANDLQYSFRQLNTGHGLVNNQTTAILKDSRGFVWIGTSSGLSRYDGVRFRNFIHESTDSTSLQDNFIVSLKETAAGDILIQTGIHYTVFDTDKEKFLSPEKYFGGQRDFEELEDIYIDQEKNVWFKTPEQIHYLIPGEDGVLRDPLLQAEIQYKGVSDFYHDGKNYYYLYASGIVECYNGRTYNLQFRNEFLNGKLGTDIEAAKIFVDRSSDIWVYGNSEGIYYYQSSTKEWRHFTAQAGDVRLSSNLIRKVIQDQDGTIWIGTDHGGIDLFDKENHKITTMYHHRDDPQSLAQNSITDIFQDDLGIIWIGTYKSGVSYYHESIYKFPYYHNLSSDPNSLPYNDVNCFAEDKKGNLWIGTNGGGLICFDRSQNRYTVYKNNPDNSNSLSNNVVVSLFVDHEDLLWIGTYTGGINTFDGQNFKNYRFNKQEKGGLPNDNIWTISQDSRKRIWIGTLGGGIILFDKKLNDFVPLPNQGDTPLPTGFINHLFKMRNGNMFIGTATGIVFYDMAGNQLQNHPFYEKETRYKIANDNVNAVYEDSRGLLWIASRAGLTLIDPNTDFVKIFNKKDGFSQDIMNCILEDENKVIWVSKSSGLSRIEVVKNLEGDGYEFKVSNFKKSDGLQGEEFNVNASFKTSPGELIFGGPNGFNIFDPDDIKFNKISANVVLTDFLIFNERVPVGKKIKGEILLNKSLASTEEIKIKHSVNVFSIEFAALNYLISDKVKFRYMLEGFDQDWVESNDDTRRVTYTNLNAGEYVFKVKAAENNVFADDDYAELKLIILPPFYRTTTAYVIYGILFIFTVLYYRYSVLKRERLKFVTEQERLQARRHFEMDEMKLKFLTNVSHEFRTPLSLILGPLEKLMKAEHDPGEKHLFETINRNAKQLLDLVNQLLDFRKLDLEGLKYNPSYGDLVSFIKDVCEHFTESFQRKGIKYKFESKEETVHMEFDHEKLRKVMMNLISNAMKFTNTNGSVTVTVEKSTDPVEKVLITVQDTGIGIPKEETDRIFERFYQSKRNLSMGYSGNGIGLNLTKEMLQLHSGSISVESEENKGAIFKVILPVTKNHEFAKNESTVIIEPELPKEPTEPASSNGRHSVLLVEDNEDFRSFMKETLLERYDVFEASDGNSGIELVYKKLPDLIISDVMMPGIDGLELCRRLKSDLRTSHIPIVLLTARTADEDKIKGLEIGADDYITKPFNMDLLLLRIQNLSDKQKQGHENFRKKMEVSPSEIEISSIDEKLIKKAIALVEENIAEPKFSVEDLSHELGMSRVYLYKKLLTITGKTPIEFIRIIRLKRGADLLQKSRMTIAEVAYSVGFNHPRYFSKHFEDEFGILPSEYLKTVKAENE